MKLWLERTLSGCKPADDLSARVLKKIEVGTTFEAEIPIRKHRDGTWHRRYWALMRMLAENVERIEIEPGAWFPIDSPERAHEAMKYVCGFYDSYLIEGGGFVRLLKSTAFEEMPADDWPAYWNKVLDQVHKRFLPHVRLDDVEQEIVRLCGEG